MEKNAAKMLQDVAKKGLALRPHVKTLKVSKYSLLV